jgi:Glycosyltransferase family 28 N-terminal domain
MTFGQPESWRSKPAPARRPEPVAGGGRRLCRARPAAGSPSCRLLTPSAFSEASTAKPQVFIATTGSRGGVEPYIALGKAMQSAGYDVVLPAAPEFSDWIASHGVAPHAVGAPVAKKIHEFADAFENNTFFRAAATEEYKRQFLETFKNLAETAAEGRSRTPPAATSSGPRAWQPSRSGFSRSRNGVPVLRRASRFHISTMSKSSATRPGILSSGAVPLCGWPEDYARSA